MFKLIYNFRELQSMRVKKKGRAHISHLDSQPCDRDITLEMHKSFEISKLFPSVIYLLKADDTL